MSSAISVGTSESARGAEVLDALPAHIAVLDARGIIVSVNESWQKFEDANGLHSPGHAVGVNYLSVCDGAIGKDAVVARQAAAGVRSVLEGTARNFSMEYPCGSALENCWFLIKVTPLKSGSRRDVLIMHVNITAQRQAEASLRESEVLLRQMAENIRDVFFLEDVRSNRILYISPAYGEIWGRSLESLYANSQSWIDVIHADDRASVREKYAAVAHTGTIELECRVVRPDGSIRWIWLRSFPVQDEAGEIARIASTARDITEQKNVQAKIVRLNRVQAILSDINALMVRASVRAELFAETCRIAVEHGNFRMAMICMVDPTSKAIVPVATSGKDDNLLLSVKQLLSSRDDAPKTLVAGALREKRAIVVNDTQFDQRVLLHKLYYDAGVRSLVVLPLVVGEQALGVFVLYANETDFFHDEEMKLLSGLADDVAFGIDHINKVEQLDYLAFYDATTGLANQSLFLERLQQTLSTSLADGRKKAICVLDIERFKLVNDAFGRKAADNLLRMVAQRLVHAGGGEATRFARVGADRFVIVVLDMENAEQLGGYVEQRLSATFDEPFSVGDHTVRVSVKVGIAVFPDDGMDADSLMRSAEAALKKAKASGERFVFFTEAMSERVAERLALEGRLRQAIDRQEFVLHYQPKLNLATRTMTGVEALIRWNDPQAGLVPPSMFIPILEETGLIHEVGRWAIRKALEDYLCWLDRGFDAVRIAVNVSALQLRNRGFVSEIGQALRIDGRAAGGLELEITESLVMEDVQYSIEVLQAIRELGVTIAIDDFGTGFSSLSYLSRLPMDTLKINRSLVNDMTVTPHGLALVSTIISLAHSLEHTVVAEGVETEEQWQTLQSLGCDEMQGFLISRPVPGEVFEARYLSLKG